MKVDPVAILNELSTAFDVDVLRRETLHVVIQFGIES